MSETQDVQIVSLPISVLQEKSLVSTKSNILDVEFQPISVKIINAKPIQIPFSFENFSIKQVSISDSAVNYAQVQILNLNSYIQPDEEGSTLHFQNALTLDSQGIETLRTIKIVPLVIGQYVQFPFEIGEDAWSDENGWLYFKPTGKTIGNADSNANYARNDLEILFKRLYNNKNLKLLNSQGVQITRTTVDNDWGADCRLCLPFHPGATLVTPGRVNNQSNNWKVGDVKGSEIYEVPLRSHSHEINQLPHTHEVEISPHSHGITQQPHNHNTNQQPHAHEIPVYNEGSSDNHGGRDFSNSGNEKLETVATTINFSIDEAEVNINIQQAETPAIAEEKKITLSVATTGDDESSIHIIPPAIAVEMLIFSGVRTFPTL